MQVLETVADPERFERPTLRFVVWHETIKFGAGCHDKAAKADQWGGHALQQAAA